MLHSLRTQAYSVLLNTLRLSLLIGDGIFYTVVLFLVTVLMIYPVSSILSYGPNFKDPSVRCLFEYTSEAEIQSGYRSLYVLYTHVIACYCADDLSGIIFSNPCSNL